MLPPNCIVCVDFSGAFNTIQEETLHPIPWLKWWDLHTMDMEEAGDARGDIWRYRNWMEPASIVSGYGRYRRAHILLISSLRPRRNAEALRPNDQAQRIHRATKSWWTQHALTSKLPCPGAPQCPCRCCRYPQLWKFKLPIWPDITTNDPSTLARGIMFARSLKKDTPIRNMIKAIAHSCWVSNIQKYPEIPQTLKALFISFSSCKHRGLVPSIVKGDVSQHLGLNGQRELQLLASLVILAMKNDVLTLPTATL